MTGRVDVESAPPFFGGNDTVESEEKPINVAISSLSQPHSLSCAVSQHCSPTLHVAQWDRNKNAQSPNESIFRFHSHFTPIMWSKEDVEKFVVAYAVSQKPNPRMHWIRTFYTLENTPCLQKQFAMLLVLYVYGGAYVHNQAIANSALEITHTDDTRVYVSESDGLWIASQKQNNSIIGAALDEFANSVEANRKRKQTTDNLQSVWAVLRRQDSNLVVRVSDQSSPFRYATNICADEIEAEKGLTNSQQKPKKVVKKGLFEHLSSLVSPLSPLSPRSSSNAPRDADTTTTTTTETTHDQTVAPNSEATWWSRAAVGLLTVFVIGAVLVGLFRRLKVDSVAQHALKSVTGNVQGWVDQRLQNWQKTLPFK